MNAVLEESFRIVSFAYVAVPHSATRDIEIGEYTIPKGATIMSSLSHVMYDPEHFPNPRIFNPDRFIDDNGIFKHNERVVPFGIGKRLCLGQSLAEKEFFLFMVGFLQKYDISPSPIKKLPSYTKKQTQEVTLGTGLAKDKEKIVKEFLGKTENPLDTILASTEKISQVTRGNQFMSNLVTSSQEALKKGSRAVLYADEDLSLIHI